MIKRTEISLQSLFLLCLAICSCCSQINAQKADYYKIADLQFEGLKKTKADFLRRVAAVKVGDTLDYAKVRKDVKYLNQLSAVTRTTVRIDTLAETASLVYDIEEAMTLFPIVNFGGVQGNFWFQLGFKEANLFGRGTHLTAFYQNNDERHNFNVAYRVPFISGSRWGISANVLRWASVEPIYFEESPVFYDYTNDTYGATVFYQFQGNHFLELGGTYFKESFQKNDRHNGETTPGPGDFEQPKLLAKVIHQINDISYDYFYLAGFFNQLNVESVFNTDYKTWFHLLLNDLRFFRRVGRWGNFAARLRLGISTNNSDPFAPFVLDSYVNIRGSGNRIDRGTAALVLNAEYRQTVYEGSTLAAQVVAFSDSGTWRNPGGSLEDLTDSDNFRHFIGGGIRLIYKKAFNAILRLDYGVDRYDFDQRGFVIGFGQYF